MFVVKLEKLSKFDHLISFSSFIKILCVLRLVIKLEIQNTLSDQIYSRRQKSLPLVELSRNSRTFNKTSINR